MRMRGIIFNRAAAATDEKSAGNGKRARKSIASLIWSATVKSVLVAITNLMFPKKEIFD